MKKHTEKERLEHVENWKSSSMSKTAYAKSVSIKPTTFYTWITGRRTPKGQGFVEINKNSMAGNIPNIVIKKNDITIQVPLTTGQTELQTILGALGDKQ